MNEHLLNGRKKLLDKLQKKVYILCDKKVPDYIFCGPNHPSPCFDTEDLANQFLNTSEYKIKYYKVTLVKYNKERHCYHNKWQQNLKRKF